MASTEHPLLKLEHVTRRFGGLKAIDDVSFELHAEELVSIVGPNGAGKTTLFNLMSGQVHPSSGEILMRGEAITDWPPHRRARLGIGRTFQIVRPVRSLTVLENVMLGGFAVHHRRSAAEKHAFRVLEDVDMAHRANVSAAALTLAERKRLEVGRALATDPSVLLLDEVMAGLNPTETDRAIDMVRSVSARGIAVMLIEHDLKVVRTLAGRVVVLDHGAEIAQGTAADVLANPQVIEAYLGVKRS